MAKPDVAQPAGLAARNRATLARQWLLERAPAGTSPLDALRHLVGMQAQVPQAPYLGLAARIEGFAPEGLSACIASRTAVRLAVMRSTLHLVAATDAHDLRRLTQVASDRGFQSNWAKKLRGAREAAFCKEAAKLLRDPGSPRLLKEVGEHIRALAPPNRGYDAEAIGALVRTRHALVQPPPRGLWRASGAAKHVLLDAWIGDAAANGAGPEASGGPRDLAWLAARYLRAYGPATPNDFATWSGVPVGAAKPAFEALAQRLRERGDEPLVDLGGGMVDVADGPRPGADAAAPVRFLPEYDNLLLAHADRGRFAHPQAQERLAGEVGLQAFLLDGRVAGKWRLDEATGVLDVDAAAALTRDDKQAIAEEAPQVGRLLAPDHQVEVRFLD